MWDVSYMRVSKDDYGEDVLWDLAADAIADNLSCDEAIDAYHLRPSECPTFAFWYGRIKDECMCGVDAI